MGSVDMCEILHVLWERDDNVDIFLYVEVAGKTAKFYRNDVQIW